jgi:hypothetical protein
MRVALRTIGAEILRDNSRGRVLVVRYIDKTYLLTCGGGSPWMVRLNHKTEIGRHHTAAGVIGIIKQDSMAIAA